MVQVETLSSKTGDRGAVVLVAVEMPTESADQRQEIRQEYMNTGHKNGQIRQEYVNRGHKNGQIRQEYVNAGHKNGQTVGTSANHMWQTHIAASAELE